MASSSNVTTGAPAGRRGSSGDGGLVDARSLGLIGLPASENQPERSAANATIAIGLGIGAFGAASLALVGTTCPLCVIAAPALVSWGLYRRFTARGTR